MKTSSNPFMGGGNWSSVSANATSTGSEKMTIDGTIMKVALLFFIVLASGAWAWKQSLLGSAAIMSAQSLAMLGAIGGFIAALIVSFKPQIASIVGPIYAVLEGLFVGAISAIFETIYPGIVMNAVLATGGVFLAMLMLYKTGVIRVTETFRTVIVTATAGIMLVYLLSFILNLMGIEMGFLHSGGVMGIGVSVFIAGIAAMNLALDFDRIEQGAKNGAPKFMEWYGAFGLLVTIVWLYIEMLRLLAKLRD